MENYAKGTSPRKRKASRANGKLGGRPHHLEVMVESGKVKASPAWVGGEMRPCDPPEEMGGDFWLFREPVSGWQWVAKVNTRKDGSYQGRYVAKGLTPHKVAEKMDSEWRQRAPGPYVGRMEMQGGPAFYPAEFYRPDPGRTMDLLREDWETRGREQWKRLDWPIEKEKAVDDGRVSQMKLARRIDLKLGPAWGQVVASWVRRGRKFPHPWGEGLRAWIRERKRQEREAKQAAEGFEV